MKVKTINKKLHKKLTENKGTTLVEMVVVFALLSIFMVSVTQVISSAIMLFNDINFTGKSVEVSDMVLTKVGGLLESCNGEIEEPVITLDAEGNLSEAVFYDRTRTKVKLKVVSNRLQVVYPTVESTGLPTTNLDGDGERNATNPYVWTFTEKSYHGFNIKNLKIEKAGDGYPDNVYKITLVINRTDYGDYVSTKYVKCYSLPE